MQGCVPKLTWVKQTCCNLCICCVDPETIRGIFGEDLSRHHISEGPEFISGYIVLLFYVPYSFYYSRHSNTATSLSRLPVVRRLTLYFCPTNNPACVISLVFTLDASLICNNLGLFNLSIIVMYPLSNIFIRRNIKYSPENKNYTQKN